ARGARHRRLTIHQLLEVGTAGETGVLVDRHRSPLSRSGALLAAALNVALDEFLGVFLEDLVDLVQEVVEVFLQLLALLGQLGTTRAAGFLAVRRLRRPGFFLLLLRHGNSPPGPCPLTGPAPGPRPWAARSPAGPGTSPVDPRTTRGTARPTRRTAPERS